MSVFERYLTLWVALCIVAGIGLGHLFPGVFQAIGAAEVAKVNLPLAGLIWLMIVPMLMKVDFAALRSVGRHWRGIGVTLLVNWAVKPFSMAALGAVFISGVLFLALSLLGARTAVMEAISPSLKHAIAVGIGLFIAFIGLQNTGLILKDPGQGVKLNPHFASPDLIVFFAGLLVAAGLYARRVRGSILWGLMSATLLAAALKWVLPHTGAWAQSKLVAESMLMTRFKFEIGRASCRERV